jgi:TolA-binding protein
MRHFLLFAILVMVGCTEPRNEPGKANRPAGTTTETTAERAKRETREAAEAIEDWTADKRVEAQLEMEEELSELDGRMAELSQRIETATGSVKERLQEEWKELEPQRELAKKRLDELKESSGEAWIDIRESAKSAFESLRQGVNRASSRFKAE